MESWGVGRQAQLEEHLVTICQALSSEDVCAAANPELLDELLLLIGDIIQIVGANCTAELSELMFVAMLNGRLRHTWCYSPFACSRAPHASSPFSLARELNGLLKGPRFLFALGLGRRCGEGLAPSLLPRCHMAAPCTAVRLSGHVTAGDCCWVSLTTFTL
jgi:hypothetical protein